MTTTRSTPRFRRAALAALVVLAATGIAPALELDAVQFPERRSTDLFFVASAGAPSAVLRADVTFRDGQSKIELSYDSMKPAILYGGDITCYVLWAVTLSGATENLGELIVDSSSGAYEFTTGKKKFALMVTAEPYYLVSRPSPLVVFRNMPSKDRRAPSSAFDFAGFDEMPKAAMESIASIAWDSKQPLELLQARKAYELAGRRSAQKHAARLYTEAGIELGKANELMAKGKTNRQLTEYARRAVALANEAINIATNRLEGIELERQIAARRAEMESLEARAAEAERNANLALDQAERARTDAEEAMRRAEASRAEQERLSSDVDQLLRSKSQLESGMAQLRTEKQQLSAEQRVLRRQLEDALGHVADTKETARGFVVNLPDILFDVNQATLKHEAEVVIAKLAGILLVMPDLKAAVEGHTDSTGSEAYNQQLSEKRALAVLEFIADQGVNLDRLRAFGFGMTSPVADNATAAGRAQNRRVEIVIADTAAGDDG